MGRCVGWDFEGIIVVGDPCAKVPEIVLLRDGCTDLDVAGNRSLQHLQDEHWFLQEGG